jgi:hypothetical protein
MVAKLPSLHLRSGLTPLILGAGGLVASVVSIEFQGEKACIVIAWLSIALSLLSVATALLYLGITIVGQRISGKGIGTLQKLGTLYPDLEGVLGSIRVSVRRGILDPESADFKRCVSDLEIDLSAYLNRHRNSARWFCIRALIVSSAVALISFSASYVSAFVISSFLTPGGALPYSRLVDWAYLGVELTLKNSSSFDIDSNLPLLVRSVALAQSIVMVSLAGTLAGMVATIASDPVDVDVDDLMDSFKTELQLLALNRGEAK